MKQTEQLMEARFQTQPIRTSLDSAVCRQELISAANWGNPIYFYIEKMLTENRFRMKINLAASVNNQELDNLSLDTVLDLIYRLLYQPEMSWQKSRVEPAIPASDTENFNTTRQVSKAHLSLPASSRDGILEPHSVLRSISIRQLNQLVEKEINLKAAEPYTVIAGLQLGVDVGCQDLSASVFWVRIRVTTGVSQTLIAAREVAEEWTVEPEICKLEIPMPGLESGQFELHASVIFPFALKSEQQKITISVIS